MCIEINPYFFIIGTSNWSKMDLQEFLNFKKWSQKKLSDASGVHINTVRNCLKKKVVPETETIVKFEKASEGLVTYYDWIKNIGKKNG